MITLNAPRFGKLSAHVLTVAMLLAGLSSPSAQATSLATSPMFISASQPPLIMLTMARDHKLYYEAYNDYSDLNGDGSLDVGYKPTQIEYYGYFDSYKCYSYASGEFTPVAMSDSVSGVYNKKCTGSGRDYWSGDFLNYVTTARIDALRKVLYGGMRSTDTTSKTVLERTFVPQDAHAWGKEYTSVTNDGYDIREYTPLDLPTTNKRHLFANVTLTGYGSAPLMRVLTNSSYRVWEWVSIERPVAGTECATGNNSRATCTGSSSSTYTSYPANASEFQALITTFATSGHQQGQRSISNIDASGTNINPYLTDPDEYYLDVFRGSITVTTAGTYQFAVDGDDAEEVWIDGTLVAGYYGGHGMCSCNSHSGSITLAAGTHSIEFRHQETTGAEGWKLTWNGPDSGNSWQTVPSSKFSGLTQTFYDVNNVVSAMTDYNVRVEVCKTISGLTATDNYGREANCGTYTDGTTTTYKPTGLLHKYGENNNMFFGLISGSYDQNTNGGILRKAISSITNEIERSTGIYKESGSTCGTSGTGSCQKGIVGTINRFHITSFDYGSQQYSCGWITTRAMNDGECEMWGNPLAEMMYEAVRYYSGATSATSSFTTSSSRDDGVTLSGGTSGLPRITTWTNPYTETPSTPIPDTGPFPHCSKPFLMLISDVYPSFDSDNVPGTDSNFGTTAAQTINGNSLNVSTRGQSIWNTEFASATKNIFIGQVGSTYDGAPTPKSASSFGNIRGLAPSDPTRQGSYYSASISNFGLLNDLNSVSGSQKLTTYSVALSAPLPTIQIPVAGNYITIVPFAKSVGGDSISATQGNFQPTNQIVDFYVDTIKNTRSDQSDYDATVNSGRPYYKFRINFEDVEQGADHDMDAISVYEISLNANNTVTVKVDSVYAAGGIMQHMGYVVSGTTADGVYLVVRDSDTSYSSDPEFYLDRPNSSDSGANSSYHLPTLSSADSDVPDASNYATRTFTASSSGTGGGVFLNDPLWYAAKYGGFNDVDGDGVPVKTVNGVTDNSEWDADGDGSPDSYFLVVNPLKLLAQLDNALGKILSTAGTAAGTSANAFTLTSATRVYVGRFNSDGWTGDLLSYQVDANGFAALDWQAAQLLANSTPDSRVIMTYDPDQASTKGIPFRWASMNSSGTTTLRSALNHTSAGTVDTLGSDRVSYLRGSAVTGMRTRPTFSSMTVTGSCPNGETYSCPANGGTATCSGGNVSVQCTLTTKPNLLGDIVYSQAQYVGRPSGGYGDASYAEFAGDYDASTNTNGKGDRTPVIYVGANDGMLHGFNALTGNEILAYVPLEMYRYRNSRWLLNKLTEADYGKSNSANAHRYYVDGTPTVGDYCTDTDAGLCASGNWRSILVGGLNGGGQGIFALNVTDPANFSESNAGTLVKWEFSDKNDSDMGYSFGRPYLVRLCTNRSGTACAAWSWYVLMNNGYNNTEADGYASTTGDAALYVLNPNATNGSNPLVKKINVQAGDTSSSGPNGLSELAPMDIDGDGVVDYVYAGDLKGNLWRFDFTGSTVASWDVGLKSGTTPVPLYVAWDEQSTRVRQPITTAPDAIVHPQGGLVVIFGTGSYIFSGDDATTQVQTMYGIWDKLDGSTVGSSNRGNLQQQQVLTSQVTSNGETYRTVTNNTVDWTTKRGWYVNLPDSKERISFNPQVINSSVLRVVSTVPSADVCAFGGYSWEYFLDPLTGGRLTWSYFDAASSTMDFGGTTAYASAMKSTTGITAPGAIVSTGTGKATEYRVGTSAPSSGGIGQGVKLNTGLSGAARLGWREILTD